MASNKKKPIRCKLCGIVKPSYNAMWVHFKNDHDEKISGHYEYVDGASPRGRVPNKKKQTEPSIEKFGEPKVSDGGIVIPLEVKIAFSFGLPTISQGEK